MGAGPSDRLDGQLESSEGRQDPKEVGLNGAPLNCPCDTSGGLHRPDPVVGWLFQQPRFSPRDRQGRHLGRTRRAGRFPASLVLSRRGRQPGIVFCLDLKLHDIPNTVAGGIRAVVQLEPTFITIHTAGGPAMMKAAAETATMEAKRLGVARPKLLGVTVLTSLDKSDLEATGVSSDPGAQAVRLATLARASGLDGVICSPLDIAAFRQACGADFRLMGPGIRPAGP